MTTVQTRTATGGQPERAGTGDSRRVHMMRGAALLVGAVALCALLPPLSGVLPIWYIGPVAGAVFIVAGLVSGRVNSLLATGLVTLAWGLGIVLGVPSAFLTVALGVGAVIAAVLGDRWFTSITRVGVALPVVYVGLGIWLHGQLEDNLTFFFAAVTALRGVWEFVLSTRESKVRESQTV